jgi:hypothetical protein
MLIEGRVEIRTLARFAKGAHPLKEGGCTFERTTTGIIDERILDDCLDRPSLLAGQLIGEVAGFGASDGEKRSGHAINLAFCGRDGEQRLQPLTWRW